MTRLCVYLYKIRLGWLVKEASGKFDFQVDPKVFDQFRLNSTVMSIAVPLAARMNRSHAERRRNFFSELLPEGGALEYLAYNARLDRGDTFQLLARYGLDVAGALEIFPEEDELHYKDGSTQGKVPHLTEVDDAQIRYLLEHTAQYPLGNEQLTGRISLAGVQTKIVLAQTQQGAWAQVHNGYPSTHIIKPQVESHPTMIFDESWGLELARRIDLISYNSFIENFDSLPALVVERYDRSPGVPGGKIHQEDFNQILGAKGAQKYQDEGGKVSLKRIAGKLEKHANFLSVQFLAKQLIFAIAIGNLDLHAKNVSVLHHFNEDTFLAQAYDLVPLQHHGVANRMAMSVAGEYVYSNLRMGHIADEMLTWDKYAAFSGSQILIFIQEYLDKILAAAKETPIPSQAYPKLLDSVEDNIERLRS